MTEKQAKTGGRIDRRRIEEIRARLARATPGPWVADLDNEYIGEGRCGGIRTAAPKHSEEYVPEIVTTDSGVYGPNAADAAFIANAPTDVADLLDEVKRLRELMQRWRYRLDDGPFADTAGLVYAELGKELYGA